ncbi:hypothetical protein B0J12DRAFT_551604, partial [Macrophomina phaseolina]
ARNAKRKKTFSEQNYYAKPNTYYAWFQRHLLYAPLFRSRKYNSYAISKKNEQTGRNDVVLVLGSIPGRIQALYVLAYFGLSAFLCLFRVDWSDRDTAAKATLQHSGTISTLNLIPLILLACRNNPMLGFCGISGYTRNTLHRWCGRLFVVGVLCHSLAYLLPQAWQGGMEILKYSYKGNEFLIWGTIAGTASCIILGQTIAPIRHALYETFYYIHISLATVAVVGVWMHCQAGNLSALLFVQIAVFIWLTEAALRVSNVVFRNFGPGATKAEISRTKDEKVAQVNLTVARPWKLEPGQHIYLTIPKIGWFTSHPFSVAWVDDEADQTGINLLVRRHSGFTAGVHSAVGGDKAPSSALTAVVQGPFGRNSFDSYGNVMFFASGVGITPHLMQIEHLQESRLHKTAAVLQIRLFWFIGSLDLFEVAWPQIKRLVDRHEYPDNILSIQLWATVKRKGLWSEELRRYNIEVNYMTLEYRQVKEALEIELEKEKGAAAVSVCGSGRFMDIVCDAVRRVKAKWNVDL